MRRTTVALKWFCGFIFLGLVTPLAVSYIYAWFFGQTTKPAPEALAFVHSYGLWIGLLGVLVG